MSEQIVDIFNLDCECSICLENIDGVSNKVVTDCGHTFHCKCLMTNVSFNGFGCPFCRNVMAEEKDDDDEEEGEDDDSDDEEYDDDDDDDDDDEEEEDENIKMPESSLVTKILQEQGYTMEDLVKIHLFLEHGQWGTHYQEYEDISGRLYRFIGEICIEYKEPPNIADDQPILPADPNN